MCDDDPDAREALQHFENAADPYHLYAASNIGSFLGLVAYLVGHAFEATWFGVSLASSALCQCLRSSPSVLGAAITTRDR